MDFPIKNGGSFHCYVSSPEGILWDYYSQWDILVGLLLWNIIGFNHQPYQITLKIVSSSHDVPSKFP